MNAKEQNYNGWKNYQTWNVSLWINNDEPLYRAAVDFMRNIKDPGKKAVYRLFIESLGLQHSQTPDRVRWINGKLAYSELNAMMRELA